MGSAWVARIGGIAFPTHELRTGTPPRVLARLGRTGWFRVFLGPGRRVVTAGGRSWRIAAAGSGPFIVPLVRSSSGMLAVATPHGRRAYGVNGESYAYTFAPSTAGLRKTTWVLREHETDVATFTQTAVYAASPVPLAAVLLCFELIRHGVPGEATTDLPAFHWR